MKKFLLSILSATLLFTSINSYQYVKAEAEDQEIVITDLDFSDINAQNVELIYREVNTKRSTTKPSVELSFDMDNVGEVYFERIGDVGYYYENSELITKVIYNSKAKQRVGMPPSITSRYFTRPATGFSTFNYWAYEDWFIEQVKGKTKDACIAIIKTALAGSFAGFALFIDAITKNKLLNFASKIYDTYNLLYDVYSGNIYCVTLFYNSQYNQCNILHWYASGIAQFQDFSYSEGEYTMIKDYEKNSTHYWYGNPNDYTQPTACRLITSDYPY